MAGRRALAPALLAAVLAICCDDAGATTIVPMTDAELAASARAIVEGTVLASEAVWSDADRVVYTYTTFDVERAYAGDVPPGIVVLKQLGGVTPAHASVVFGSPCLDPGRRAILFLNADGDGALHVAHMTLGCFLVERDEATGEDAVVRSLAGAVAERAPVRGIVTSRAPRADFLARVLGEVAAKPGAPSGAAPRAPVAILPAEFGRAPGGGAGFTFLGSGFRWFEPDTGGKVGIRVNATLAPAGLDALDAALAAFEAWSSVSGSSLRVVHKGPSASGGVRKDGLSIISWGDPRDQIDDLVNCRGILAIAVIAGQPAETREIGDRTFARITEGDLVINNGIECLVGGDRTVHRELVTHEFGHVLGLGHSSEVPGEPDARLREATMYYLTHNDGRGASLRIDDSDAIRFLYAGRSGDFALLTEALPDAVPNTAYDVAIAVRGGTSPYTWQVAAGALPPGLALTERGHIEGTPTSAATSTLVLRVRDSEGATAERELALTVSTAPAPFLDSCAYRPGKRRLFLTGRYLDASASVTVNGVQVAPPQRVRFKPSHATLSVAGSRAELGILGDGANTITVTIGGATSNTLRF